MGSDSSGLSVGDALRREVQKSIAEMRKHRERRDHPMVKCARCKCHIFKEDAIKIEYKKYGLTTWYNICIMCARRGKKGMGMGVA